MDYEKKYKEALERAKKGECLENIFPELKESEDDKMRAMVIKAVHAPEAQSCIKSWGVNPDDVIAWLEKQCAQKPIISNNALREGISYFGITQYQIDNWLKKYVDVEKQAELQYWKPSKEQLEALDYAYNSCPDTERGNYYEGVLRTLIDELYKLQPKQDKPKPVDKVQPKFKVGDWITNNIETVQITGYDIDYGYQVDYKGKLQHRDTDIIEKEYHLWTIQDAKDGDVLVDSYAIIIFRKIGNYVLDDVVDFYICYSFEKGIIIQRHNLHCGFIDSVFFKPVTKEQRDMFFQKMHEAGYEWDFEVKELNKIEKKPVCSEEEKQLLLKDLCGRLPYGFKYQVQYGDTSVRDIKKFILDGEYSLFDTWMVQEIKPYLRSMSSMTEEEKKTLNNVLEYQYCSDDSCMCESTDWLNSHHFDYRGLIEKGLALEAPFGMYQ